MGSDLSLGGSVSSSTKGRRHTSLRGLQVRLPEITGHTWPRGLAAAWGGAGHGPGLASRGPGRFRPRPQALGWKNSFQSPTTGPPPLQHQRGGRAQHGRGLTAPPGSRASVRTDCSPAPLNIVQGMSQAPPTSSAPDHQEGQLLRRALFHRTDLPPGRIYQGPFSGSKWFTSDCCQRCASIADTPWSGWGVSRKKGEAPPLQTLHPLLRNTSKTPPQGFTEL